MLSIQEETSYDNSSKYITEEYTCWNKKKILNEGEQYFYAILLLVLNSSLLQLHSYFEELPLFFFGEITRQACSRLVGHPWIRNHEFVYWTVPPAYTSHRSNKKTVSSLIAILPLSHWAYWWRLHLHAQAPGPCSLQSLCKMLQWSGGLLEFLSPCNLQVQ